MMRRKHITIIVGGLLILAAMILVSYTSRQPSWPDFLRDQAKQTAYANIAELARNFRTDGALLPTDATLTRIVRDPMEAPPSAYEVEFDTDSLRPVHPAVKALAQAIVAKGKDAEDRHQYQEAADAYLNVLELGVNYEHGPIIYFLVGAAIESLGLRALKPLIPKLSSEEIAALARRIQSINDDRIPFYEIMRREEYFAAQRTKNFVELIKYRFTRSTRAMITRTRKVHNICETQCEGIAGAAAALVYLRQTSQALTNLESLTPKYLARVPRDVVANGPMRLVSLANGPVIYSIGANGRDDQGRGDDIPFSFEGATTDRTNSQRTSP